MIDFNKMVTNHIEREHRPKQIGRYYPSEVGGCLRKTWYSYKYPKQVDPELMKIFELGNIMHGFVVEVLKSEKNQEVELLKSEFPLKIEEKDFTISGRVDDLILVKASGKNVLVEVKSTKDIKFVKKAQPSHEMQLVFYMHASGVHNGVILYVDKSNLQSKTFEVPYTKEKADEILDRFKLLNDSLVNNNMPEAEATKTKETTWMCKYCEYADKCKKGEG
ncbi:MAG: PD-(D/E)XK nuclease family protein [Candidatus Aenigmatarchaeota archaeon]